MQSKFDLTTLNGANGFNVTGIAPSDQLGYSLASAGDMNGDGLSDLVLGAIGEKSYFGAAHVIFGSREQFTVSFNLINLNGTNGFSILGIKPFDYIGRSVSSAGDMNGDGLSDLVLGADGVNASTGMSYVIFGSLGGFPAIFNVTNLNGTNGFSIPGIVPSAGFGNLVSTAGDINGDGLSDLVVASATGPIYVIFGSRNALPSIFDLTALNGTNGFRIVSYIADSYVSVATAGDMNGDGFSDLILGFPQANSNVGVSYVIFGTQSGFPAIFNLTILNGTNGFTIPGSEIIPGTVWGLGNSVATAGDMNGDGISEIVLGNAGANLTGISYVIFGMRAPFPPIFDLTVLNGVNGFRIPGVSPLAQLGNPVATAGDMNRDGLSDLILAAPATNPARGAAHVIFGTRKGFPTSFDLNQLNGSNGFTIPELYTNSFMYISVASAGDMNGDGFSDLIVGTRESKSYSGACYIIFPGLGSIKITNNLLTINQGQTVLLTNRNLNVIGLVPFDLLAFSVTQVQGGRFTLVSNPNTPIFNFTQTQINSGQIQFVSDRTAPVYYQVGMMNVTDGSNALAPNPASVTFINRAPFLINPPTTQVVTTNEPFSFSFAANQIFTDPDGDPLAYSAELSNQAKLPSWIQFNNNQPNQLAFTGTAPFVGGTQISLFAKDRLNANASANFEILATSSNRTVLNNVVVSAGQIAGSIIGGVAGLAALIGFGLSFWRHTSNKNSRRGEYFADYIREALNLKDVDNFTSDAGQTYLNFVYVLQKRLTETGVDHTSMRPGELQDLANDVATAARNKITSSTDCLGRSEIEVAELNKKMQEIVTEVQILRRGVQTGTYVV